MAVYDIRGATCISDAVLIKAVTIYFHVSNLMENRTSLAEVAVFLQSKLANGGDISCTNSLEKSSSKMLPWLMHSLLILLPPPRLQCSQCTTRRDKPDARWKLNGTPVRQFGSDLVLALSSHQLVWLGLAKGLAIVGNNWMSPKQNLQNYHLDS